MTRILIVDDQDDMRAGIRAMLLLDPTLVVAGDLSDGLQVMPFLREHPADLVLMDIRMPGIDGVEATRRIRREHPPERLRVIVLTVFDQDEIVLAALRAGDSPGPASSMLKTVGTEMMQRLAQVFADERGKLEEQWSRGDDIGTEDLRQALRRYRSFFDRLLTV